MELKAKPARHVHIAERYREAEANTGGDPSHPPICVTGWSVSGEECGHQLPVKQGIATLLPVPWQTPPTGTGMRAVYDPATQQIMAGGKMSFKY
jgi:hypothetical protein